MENVCAFVLAGGQSTRMGEDKALLQLDGRSLLERALELARGVSSEVRIVGSREKFAQFGTVVEDRLPNHGPLGGIHAALRSSSAEWNLILAVDMPYVEARFLQFLLEQAQLSKAAATVPRAAGGWQPLCAVYRREFADLAERALNEGKNKIDALFGQIEMRVIQENELTNFRFSAEMFRNLNTPEEFQRARQA